MLPYFAEEFGNAASRTHAYGWRAEEAVERARAQVAALVGADPREVVFTSGATEANNLAILGSARALRRAGGAKLDRIVTCRTEHRAVLDPVAALEREGFRATLLPVDGEGRVDPDALRAALAEPTALVSIMHANNEIGTLQPIRSLAGLAHEAGAAFHCDAAQSAGALALDATQLGVDFLSLSAHKLYGPKGIGALVVRRRAPHARLEPILHGGGHERGLRSGTLPVALCVGFGARGRAGARAARRRRQAPRAPARPALGAALRRAAAAGAERSARRAAARQPERLVPRRRGRGAAGRAARARALDRLRLHVGEARAVARAAGARRRRAPRALGAALRDRARQHRRRDRARRPSS